MASKVDMSLADIIAMDRQQQQRGGRGRRGRGRGRGQSSSVSRGRGVGGATRGRGMRGRGRGRQQQQTDGVAVVRGHQRQTLQQSRQAARTDAADQRRSLQTNTGGMRQRGRGRGRGAVNQGRGAGGRGRGLSGRGRGLSGRGRGVGGGRGGVGGGTTAMTDVKSRLGSSARGRGMGAASQRGMFRGVRGRGRGLNARVSVARAAVNRARAHLQTQPMREQQSPRGRRRGWSRGRAGRRQLHSENMRMQVSIVQPQCEPEGVDLTPDVMASHHTSKSLDSRFTPEGRERLTERLVLPNGRAVNYMN